MCETAIRQSDTRRAKRRKKSTKQDSNGEDDDSESSCNSLSGSSDESSDEDSSEDDATSTRASLKASYLAKVLSPVLGYGADYELFQFVWDLHMWSMLGGKKNLHNDVPLRVMLAGSPFRLCSGVDIT